MESPKRGIHLHGHRPRSHRRPSRIHPQCRGIRNGRRTGHHHGQRPIPRHEVDVHVQRHPLPGGSPLRQGLSPRRTPDQTQARDTRPPHPGRTVGSQSAQARVGAGGGQPGIHPRPPRTGGGALSHPRLRIRSERSLLSVPAAVVRGEEGGGRGAGRVPGGDAAVSPAERTLRLVHLSHAVHVERHCDIVFDAELWLGVRGHGDHAEHRVRAGGDTADVGQSPPQRGVSDQDAEGDEWVLLAVVRFGAGEQHCLLFGEEEGLGGCHHGQNRFGIGVRCPCVQHIHSIGLFLWKEEMMRLGAVAKSSLDNLELCQ
mmetsp:Transcript_23866/g.49960  ORF Transcript_23866/g.49960 Transcript_23866/m.49960 type:complete len:314 (+) Transcript_23866:147-1088(+)